MTGKAQWTVVSWTLAATATAAAGWSLTDADGPSNAVQAKRRAPAKVNAVVHTGIRYAAVHSGSGSGRRPGGYVQAWDIGGEKELWSRAVYWTRIDPRLERDVQEVLITKLELVEGKLVVDNEKGERYEMDLALGKVIARIKKSDRTEVAKDEEGER